VIIMTYEIAARERYEHIVELPEGASATYEHGTLTVTGQKGSVARALQSKDTAITIDGSAITLTTTRPTKRHKREIHTFRAHINNMIEGAVNGHTYTLKIASSHFPITVQNQNGMIIVKNFVGEKKPRSARIPQGVNVAIDGDTITITSSDLEKAGNFAGALEKLCVRPNFDNRIFQDGLYITEKNGRTV
jgi:large subunit ribosomal protein L6